MPSSGLTNPLARLAARSPLILDTETTGVDELDEVVEIALLDIDGRVLLDTLVRPTTPVTAEASLIHGITDRLLQEAPTWPEVAGQLAALVEGRLVVAHNASFDRRIIRQTCQAWQTEEMPVGEWACTMDLLTDANGGRWPSLEWAMRMVTVDAPAPSWGSPHRARYDAECCRRVLTAFC